MARALAWVLLGLIFWLDTLTPVEIGDPALYVAAILLFIPAGFWWEPLLVAAAARVLTIAGVYISHPTEVWTAALWNRPLALIVI